MKGLRYVVPPLLAVYAIHYAEQREAVKLHVYAYSAFALA